MCCRFHTLPALPEQDTAITTRTVGGSDSEDAITAWHIEEEVRTGKYSLTDYNSELRDPIPA